jgi:hypothetical protein
LNNNLLLKISLLDCFGGTWIHEKVATARWATLETAIPVPRRSEARYALAPVLALILMLAKDLTLPEPADLETNT